MDMARIFFKPTKKTTNITDMLQKGNPALKDRNDI
jgi:hypothetical protein